MSAGAALVLAGLTLGLSASPHCALMCGAPCASLTSGCRRSSAGFHLARLLGYSVAGGVAAASVAALAHLAEAAPALRPLWLLMQLAVLALGAWWLLTGRQPAPMRAQAVVAPLRFLAPGSKRHWRASLAGLLWVLLPCAALQGALLLAALASDALTGALVMLMFALGSAPALALTTWLWARWQRWAERHHRRMPAPRDVTAWSLRLAGAGLVLMSGWALTQGLWLRLAAWCA